MISRKSIAWKEWPEIRATWDTLCDRSPQGSFFLTADWVEAWLEVYGPSLNPEFLLFQSAGETVGACFLVRSTMWRKYIRFRRVHVNSGALELDDNTAIEYNALLSLEGHEESVGESLAEYLAQCKWDELVMEGLHTSVARHIRQLGGMERVRRPAQYVDLQRIREAGGGYDAALSSNTRQQIRRSIKLYEQTGAIRYHEAATAEEALAELKVLAELHQAAWTDRGKPGVFSSAVFVDFHEKLVRKALPKGRVRVIVIRAGETPIAALYNFVYRGRVYFYQSGFAYAEDNKLKPGMVAHYLAIQESLKDPTIREYDFLAGEQRYKKSMATDERPLDWVSLMRGTPSVRLFQLLRRLRGYLRPTPVTSP